MQTNQKNRKPENSPSAAAKPRLPDQNPLKETAAEPKMPEAYSKMSKAVRAYGWEGGKEVPIALALDELLSKPSVPLADLIALARREA